ncbi:hypothetical protein ACHAXA_010709 [Cyclostephanos tholiformis]|uniref:F-box domain-containing protein n=1 Tax=Cyclostephanos tholiformis TaxID=382380 RepID=A0ABD3R816_9STRA
MDLEVININVIDGAVESSYSSSSSSSSSTFSSDAMDDGPENNLSSASRRNHHRLLVPDVSSLAPPPPVLRRNSSGGGNCGILEDCGRWLMSIPRDDVVALQQTSEYRDFLLAFEGLGEAHRRIVTLERQQMEEDDIVDDCGGMDHCFCDDVIQHQPGSTISITSVAAPSSASSARLVTPSSPRSSSTDHHRQRRRRPRRHYSFLQHLAVDDVLLRVLDYLDCSSLVRTGATCHRFRELSNRSAEQRSHRLYADGRLLRGSMRMLRALEQIDGVGQRGGNIGPFVPIPMLGLGRRVRVVGAGDPEYDGVYFCTGCNGNGFLFTKPRWPERRVGGIAMATITTLATRDGGGGGGDGEWWRDVNDDDAEDDDARPPWGLDDEEPMEEIPVVMDGGMGAAAMAEAIDPRRRDDDVNHDPDGEEDGDAEEDNDEEVARMADAPFGDERNYPSRLLRCIIAKRFSNETLLWYMSKEVEDEVTREIKQTFSFWAKLLVTGDASPDVCQYPSQTSILSRNGEPAWQHLTSTLDVAPPTVELLDG